MSCLLLLAELVCALVLLVLMVEQLLGAGVGVGWLLTLSLLGLGLRWVRRRSRVR